MKDTYLTNNFIERAKRIHKDKPYDYSKVSCTKHSDIVTITCKIHGDFKQAAYSHITGRGCKNCSHSLTQEEYLLRINKFNLQLVSPYLGVRFKVKYYCMKHGEQEDIAENLLHGGCNRCKYPYRTINDFLEITTEIHGTHPTFIYKNLKEPIFKKTKIEIFCLNCETSSFPTVHNHLKAKGGCKRCWGGKRNMKK